MSLDIIKRNSGSPFHLQRSIVAQGDENGAYSQGGYDPENVYSNSGIAAGISAFGKTVEAGLGAITDSDRNAMDVKKKARLEKRETKISDKINQEGISDKKSERLTNRLSRVDKRKEASQSRIDDYNKKRKTSLLTDTEE
jgi:hypothetical protein